MSEHVRTVQVRDLTVRVEREGAVTVVHITRGGKYPHITWSYPCHSCTSQGPLSHGYDFSCETIRELRDLPPEAVR